MSCDYIAESLMYERAIVRLNTMISNTRQEKNRADIEARKNGDKPDRHYAVVIKLLKDCVDRCQRESDKLWKMAEEESTPNPDAVERLLNAVCEQAALDYEQAASGMTGDADAIMREIERFGRDNAEDFTDLDFPAVLAAIRRAERDFQKLVKDWGADIIEETKRRRKSKEANNFVTMPYKCPLCGGGLYEYGSSPKSVHAIVCTGCNLGARWLDNAKSTEM